jgi:hypothetical protein
VFADLIKMIIAGISGNDVGIMATADWHRNKFNS